ncbi:S8 family serine peptidase [Paenibacillus senegalensis]|uniref:S8 family serine peptidase n=1 Tax=Paenibacillus senegalensis TaxID=1465766 RepID=UPI00028879B2|nr:S8 family serine peptidase [Paenibacillus senegalensis]
MGNRTSTILIMFLCFLVMLSSLPMTAYAALQEKTHKPVQGRTVQTKDKVDLMVREEFNQQAFVTYLVKLKEKADVNQASRLAEQHSLQTKASPLKAKLMARNYVIHALKETAEQAQTDVAAYLEKAAASGKVKEYQSFYIVNVIAVTSTEAVMNELAQLDEVEEILPNRTRALEYEAGGTGEAVMELASEPGVYPWNLSNIGVPQVWEMGYDGTGVVIANMDSGVDYTHPALAANWRGNNAGEEQRPELHWYDATAEKRRMPYDGDGHGTHVMGTMAGNKVEGELPIGVAPGAQWIAVRIFDSEGTATDRGILDAGEWILAPRNERGEMFPSLAPDIVNNSWGSGSGKNEFFLEIVEAWRAANILPVFSAGNVRSTNPGGDGSITAPGNYPSSFAVGAVDRHRQLADFSLWGPSPYGEIKPDLVAPGVNIRSALPGHTYGLLSGTSMASPHTAGVAALILQSTPSLEVDELEKLLSETAEPLTDDQFPQVPNHGYGWGQVNAFRAVSSVSASGTGRIEGQITVEGHDDIRPAIEHTPIHLMFNAADQTISAAIRDNVGVKEAELRISKAGTADWMVLPMSLVSGNRRSGTYEAVIPAEDLLLEGIQYQLRAEDYAGNQTQTDLVEVSVSEGIKAGYYQDFESDIAGFEFQGNPGIWQWGKPQSGPLAAYSGEKVLATVLAGNYPVGTESFFVLPIIDLRDGAHTILSFRHWYKLGSWMDVIQDTAEVWIGVRPRNSTDKSEVQFELAKLYERSSGAWEIDYIDLSPYRGEQIYVAFQLRGKNGSDEGWYIDDIALELPAEGVPQAPQGVEIRSNTPGRVIINWDKVEDDSIKEYVVYRSATGEEGSFEEIGATSSSAVYSRGTYGDQPVPQKGTYYYYLTSRTYSLAESAPSGQVSWTFTGGEEIFSDDFEGENLGWTINGEPNDWAWGVPDPAYARGPKTVPSGDRVWATNLSGDMLRQTSRSLVSPVIDLTAAGHAVIYYQNWFDLDDGDRGYVEITKDGGITWSPLYMLTNAYSTSRPSKWWFLEEVRIRDEFLGHQVQIRFRLESRNSLYVAGWYIDDVEVRETEPVKSAVYKSTEEEPARIPDGEQAPPKLLNTTAGPQANYEEEFTPDQMKQLPASAMVTIEETGQSARTESGSGLYSLVHPAGDYNIKVEAYGYHPHIGSVQVSKGGTSRFDATLVPLSKGQVSGRITDKDGNPLSGVSVKLLEDAHVPAAYTDDEGSFVLEAYEGDYTLSAAKKDYDSLTIPVSIAGDQTSELALTFHRVWGLSRELAYDSGSEDNAVAFSSSGNAYGVRMSPEQPVQVTGAKFYFSTKGWPDPGGSSFQYALFEADRHDGLAGNVIAGPYEGRARSDGQWTEVHFPHPIMVDGDFYVAYIQSGDYPNVPGLAVDETGVDSGRSFRMENEVWQKPTAQGNFLIRALVTPVENEPPITGLKADPPYPVVLQGEELPLTVHAIRQSGEAVNVTSHSEFTVREPDVAEVDRYGTVKGIKAGRTVIAVTYEEWSIDVELEVREKPGADEEIVAIMARPSDLTLKQGESAPLSIWAEVVKVKREAAAPKPVSEGVYSDFPASVARQVYQDSTGESVLSQSPERRWIPVTHLASYTTGNEKVAAVDSAGRVYAVGVGDAVINVNYEQFRTEVRVRVAAGEDPVPGKPEEPGTPGDPDRPEEPGGPGDSDGPEGPGKPAQPGTPGEPQQPEEPGKPQEPQEPQEPEVPEQPQSPGRPGYYGPFPILVDNSEPITSKDKVIGRLNQQWKNGSEEAVLLLDSQHLTDQLRGEPLKRKAPVSCDLSSVSFESYGFVTVKLDRAAAGQLIESGRTLQLIHRDFELELSEAALSDLIDDAGELTIRIGLEKDSLGQTQLLWNGRAVMVSSIVSLQTEQKGVLPLVTLRLRTNGSLLSDSRKTAIYSDKSGEWGFQGLSLRKGELLELEVEPAGAYAIMEYNRTFKDISSHWGKDYVEVLASQHIITGSGTDQFSPEALITRGEFAALLDRIAGLDHPWSYYAARPDAHETLLREEMVLNLVKALGTDLTDYPSELAFADRDEISADAQSAIRYAYDQGWVVGMGDNQFAGREGSTRAQAAALLYKVLRQLNLLQV